MPPKVKITKEEIVLAALDLARKSGSQAVNARSVAVALQCSTQPIFFNFSSMEELQAALSVAAYERYLGFLREEAESGKYPRYKAFGMAYVRFAREEKELFKLLFMCDRKGKDSGRSPDFEASVKMIMASGEYDRETAERMHLEMWTCVHGIGVMLATSYLSLEWELISQMLSEIYCGIKAVHGSEGKNNECH